MSDGAHSRHKVIKCMGKAAAVIVCLVGIVFMIGILMLVNDDMQRAFNVQRHLFASPQQFLNNINPLVLFWMFCVYFSYLGCRIMISLSNKKSLSVSSQIRSGCDPPAGQEGRHILSRREHVRLRSTQEVMRLLGNGLGVLAAILGLLTLNTLTCIASSATPANTLLIGLCGGLLVFLLGKWARDSFRYANRIDLGIPLSRANTAHLPAEESLVRASQEPIEQQQTVLLRPVFQSATTPVEQLVRPAHGNGK